MPTRLPSALYVAVLCTGCLAGGGSGVSDGNASTGQGSIGSLEEECQGYCRNYASTRCRGTASEGSCMNSCVSIGEDLGCETQWNALNHCQASAELFCDVDGNPAVGEECFPEVEDYLDCPLDGPLISGGGGGGSDCTSDEDCASTVNDRCDVRTGECVECRTDDDCSGVFGACDPASGECVSCVEDSCDGTCDGPFGCVECTETTDCAPSQECASDMTCRERCSVDGDCPSGICYIGSCGDTIGDTCALDEFRDCRGLDCIDADANLLTVEPYCTDNCFSGDICPDGFACVDYDCRKL